jgi:hypothetical protein
MRYIIIALLLSSCTSEYQVRKDNRTLRYWIRQEEKAEVREQKQLERIFNRQRR